MVVKRRPFDCPFDANGNRKISGVSLSSRGKSCYRAVTARCRPRPNTSTPPRSFPSVFARITPSLLRQEWLKRGSPGCSGIRSKNRSLRIAILHIENVRRQTF